MDKRRSEEKQMKYSYQWEDFDGQFSITGQKLCGDDGDGEFLSKIRDLCEEKEKMEYKVGKGG